MTAGTYVSIRTPQGDASQLEHNRGTVVEVVGDDALVQFSAPRNDKPRLIALSRLVPVALALLAFAIATGCVARAIDPDGTTYEIDTRGGEPDSSRAVLVAPTGPAAATHDAGDATANALLGQIARAVARLDWRGARQGCADLMEWAHGREVARRDSARASDVAAGESAAVAGVRERADEAFWKELER